MKCRLTYVTFIISAYLMIVGCATVPKTPLIEAVTKGDTITIQKLIKDGGNINEADSSGITPLIYSVWSENIEVLKTLLSLGANVNQKDTSGNSAIYYATYNGNPNIAKLLYLSNRAMGKGGIQDVKKVCKDFQEDTIIISKGRPLYDAYLNYRYLYPKITYKGNKKISITVHDQRSYVLSKEKAAGYVGLWRERGLMRPYVYDIGTLSQKPLSDDLTFCISEALSDAGFLIINNQTQAQLSYEKAETTSSNVERIIIVDIMEWITDTYSGTGLYYNVNMNIFDENNQLLVTKHIKGEDNLGGSGGMTKRFIYESVPTATENILSTMFNTHDVMSVLTKENKYNPSVSTELVIPNLNKTDEKMKKNGSEPPGNAQKLKELKNLKDEGLLTDKEYEQKRKVIVDGI
jgi:hypothetical protein